MTNREAIRLLKTKKGQPSTDYQLGEALQMAIAALEKQIPKRKLGKRSVQRKPVYNQMPDMRGADL